MSALQTPNNAVSLVTIHKVITRGLDVSIHNTRRFKESGFPDLTIQTGFLNYVRALSAVLHGHHSTEDELAFPYFRKLLPELPVDSLSAQHQDLIPILEAANTAVDACSQASSAEDGLSLLSTALTQIDVIWHPHIQIEEKHFDIQTLGQMLPPEEHQRLNQLMGKHSQEHTGQPFLTVPFMLYNLPVDTRSILADDMPAEVTSHLVPVVWREQWITMKPFLLEIE